MVRKSTPEQLLVARTVPIRSRSDLKLEIYVLKPKIEIDQLTTIGERELAKISNMSEIGLRKWTWNMFRIHTNNLTALDMYRGAKSWCIERTNVSLRKNFIKTKAGLNAEYLMKSIPRTHTFAKVVSKGNKKSKRIRL